MKSQEYEELVKNLLSTLLAKYNVEIIGYGEKCKIEGVCGHKHQIDVACRDKEKHKLILVECKHWKSKIKIEYIMAFHGRIMDIQNKEKVGIEGIMITTVGYQKGADKYANHYGIRLGKVKNMSEFGLFIGTLGFIGVADECHAEEKVSIKIVPAEDK